MAILCVGGLYAVKMNGAPGLAGCRFVEDVDRRTRCLGQRTADQVRQHGLAAATKKFERTWAAHPDLGRICHNAGHLAARETYEGSPRPFTAAQDVRGCFAWGYRHGIIDMAVGSARGGKLVEVVGFCSAPGRGRRDECFRGIGYGLERQLGVMKGSRQCERVSAAYNDRVACKLGVFMSDANARIGSTEMRHDPLPPCPKMPEGETKQLCHTMVATRALWSGYSFPSIATRCAGVEGANNRRACYWGLGEISLLWTRPKPVGSRLSLCNKLDAGMPVQFCIRGVFSFRMFELADSPTDTARECATLSATRGKDCADAAGATFSLAAKLGYRRSTGDCRSSFEGAEAEACARGRLPVPGLVSLAE